MTRRLRIGLLLAAVAFSVVAMLIFPVSTWMQALVAWIRDAGPWGVSIFAAVYVLATVLLLPGSALTLGAGFAYGPVWGTLLVSPVSVVAATAAFFLGRTVAHDWIARRIAQDRRFAAIDRAVREHGLRFVLLLRLSPLFPFSMLNYALGLTTVRVRDYVLGSFIGMLPGTILYVYLGSLVTNTSHLASGVGGHASTLKQVLYWGGLICTLVVTVWLTRTARRALRRSLDAAPPAQEDPK